jgi:hypothetical protein
MDPSIHLSELQLREDLKALLFEREAEVKPLCAALDTALGEIQRSDQEPVYEAVFALTARLMRLRAEQLSDERLRRVVVLTERYSDDEDNDYGLRIARNAIALATKLPSTAAALA